MLTSATILERSQAILAPHGIKVVAQSENTPEEHLYRQYRAIVDEFGRLDTQTFDIAQDFLGKFDDKNTTVRFLQARCHTAFEDLSDAHIIFLETHLTDKSLVQMGAHELLADAYESKESFEKAADHLTQHILATGNRGDRFKRLAPLYAKAGRFVADAYEVGLTLERQGIKVSGLRRSGYHI